MDNLGNGHNNHDVTITVRNNLTGGAVRRRRIWGWHDNINRRTRCRPAPSEKQEILLSASTPTGPVDPLKFLPLTIIVSHNTGRSFSG